MTSCGLCDAPAVCSCDGCGREACGEHARGGEVVECDPCHDAREAEAFATLGGLEHRAWQEAMRLRSGS